MSFNPAWDIPKWSSLILSDRAHTILLFPLLQLNIVTTLVSANLSRIMRITLVITVEYLPLLCNVTSDATIAHGLISKFELKDKPGLPNIHCLVPSILTCINAHKTFASKQYYKPFPKTAAFVKWTYLFLNLDQFTVSFRSIWIKMVNNCFSRNTCHMLKQVNMVSGSERQMAGLIMEKRAVTNSLMAWY